MRRFFNKYIERTFWEECLEICDNLKKKLTDELHSLEITKIKKVCHECIKYRYTYNTQNVFIDVYVIGKTFGQQQTISIYVWGSEKLHLGPPLTPALF